MNSLGKQISLYLMVKFNLSFIIKRISSAEETHINLPVMDGLEIYNLVRARKSLDGVGVILLDAWGMRGPGWGEIIKKVQSNGDEIVLKPIDPRTFIGFVEKVLENHGKSHLIASKAL